MKYFYLILSIFTIIFSCSKPVKESPKKISDTKTNVINIETTNTIEGIKTKDQLTIEEKKLVIKETNLENKLTEIQIINTNIEIETKTNTNFIFFTPLNIVRSINTNSFDYQFKILENNIRNFKKNKLLLNNPSLLSIFSNEINIYNLSLNKVNLYNDCISNYLVFSQIYTNEKAFFFKRIGILYFKNKNYRNSYIYLNQAREINLDDDEVNYHLSILEAFYKKNYSKSLRILTNIAINNINLPLQDYYYFYAFLLEKLGRIDEAEKYYLYSLSLDKTNFFRKYSLENFYYNYSLLDNVIDYLNNSGSYLTNSTYKIKGYLQIIQKNILEKKESFIKIFEFPETFSINKNILYHYRFTPPQVRRKSSYLPIPLQERRQSKTDIIYYNFFEEIINEIEGNDFILLMGRPTVKNVKNNYSNLTPGIDKYYTIDNHLLIINSTPIINLDQPQPTTNSLILFRSNLNLPFLYSVDKIPSNDGKRWDYLVLGFDQSNKMNAFVLNTSNYTLSSFSFRIERPKVYFVIQDIDNDGKNDYFLLDNNIRFIRP